MANNKFDLSDLGASSADLSDLGATQANQQQASPLAGGRFGLSPFTLGAASALANTATGALNLLPGVNIPKWEPSSGTGYEAGKLAGDVASYLIPGKAITAIPKTLVAGAEVARGAGQVVPELSALTKLLGSPSTAAGIARRTLGGGLLGAATTEGDYSEKGMGALKGAGISAALDIPTAGLAGLVKGAGKLGNSQQMAENIVQGIKGVGKNIENPIEETGKSIAQKIEDLYNQELENASSFYKPISEAHGNKEIYAIPENFEKSGYLNLDKNVIDKFNPDLKELHENFSQSPTFDNAHKLQSGLGFEIRDLASKGRELSYDEKGILQQLTKARSALKGDINTYLTTTDPEKAALYNLASENYVKNIAPFRNEKAIYQMATGKLENPKNVINAFRNPNENVSTIVDKLGPDTSNQILYSGIAKQLSKGVTPEKLLNSAMDLDKKGLGSYATPEFREQLSNLLAQMNKEGNIKKGLGFVGGALVAPHLTGGLPINKVLSEMLGGLGGAGLAAKSSGLGAISTALKGLQKTYPWLRTPVASYLTRGNE